MVGIDFIRWLTGQLSIFDPRGLVAFAGVHLFLIAPILLVATNIKLNPLAAPVDWRPWVGAMALFNAVGMFLVQKISDVSPTYRKRTQWDFSTRTTPFVLGGAILLTGISQLIVWSQSGVGASGGTSSGMFKYSVLGSSFPIVCLLGLTYLQRKKTRSRNQLASFLVLALFIVAYFVFDGLRGSRSTLLWSIFAALGIIHYFWRPISNRLFLVGLIPAVGFLYLYGFYKAYGDEVLDRYSEAGSLEALSKETGRSPLYVLTMDMSRVDVQAILLWRWFSIDYDERLGMTYVKSLIYTTIPPSLWGGRPSAPEKALAGAELLYARKGGRVISSRVYGLTGEGILNFGVFGVLPAFLVFALLMRWLRRRHQSYPPGDLRFAVAPLWANFMLILLVGDFDNAVVFFISKCAVPLVLIWLLRERRASDFEETDVSSSTNPSQAR